MHYCGQHRIRRVHFPLRGDVQMRGEEVLQEGGRNSGSSHQQGGPERAQGGGLQQEQGLPLPLRRPPVQRRAGHHPVRVQEAGQVVHQRRQVGQEGSRAAVRGDRHVPGLPVHLRGVFPLHGKQRRYDNRVERRQLRRGAIQVHLPETGACIHRRLRGQAVLGHDEPSGRRQFNSCGQLCHRGHVRDGSGADVCRVGKLHEVQVSFQGVRAS